MDGSDERCRRWFCVLRKPEPRERCACVCVNPILLPLPHAVAYRDTPTPSTRPARPWRQRERQVSTPTLPAPREERSVVAGARARGSFVTVTVFLLNFLHSTDFIGFCRALLGPS